jgi:hypothetical protein
MNMIRVKNNLRRPVLFRIPGQSVRLGPGQAIELPGHCKDAAELKALYLRNALSLSEAGVEAEAPAPAKAKEEKPGTSLKEISVKARQEKKKQAKKTGRRKAKK